MTASEAMASAGDSKEVVKEKEPSIGSSRSTLEAELYEKDKEPDGVLANDTKETNINADTDTQKIVFTMDKDEEQDRFQENKVIKTLHRVPSMPSFCTECNNEVYLRPHNLYQNRVLSSIVTPNRSSLPPRKTVSTGDLRRPLSAKNKNENMVLQLVLPSGSQNSNHENNNYLTATSIDDILGNGHLKERNSRPHSVHSQQDFYSSLNTSGYINRTYSTSDLSEYGHQGGTLGGHSIPPTPALSSEPDKPTPPDEKKKAFQSLLTNVLSVFYAIFNITLGLAVYVSDIVDGTRQIAEIFSLLLVIVAFMYILYLTLDISYHMRKKHKYDKLLEKNTPEAIEMKERADGNFQFNITLPEVVTLKKSLEHHYCFKKDRHSTNFYLKVGAAGFCFGHLIHSGLLLGYQIVFLTSDDTEFYECASVATLVLDIIYPIYSFLLLFFMFKYSNVIINRNTVVARFGIMHCLSSSLCFWVWTIFRETVEALASKDDYAEYTTAAPNDIVTPDANSQPYALPLTSFSKRGAQILTDYVSAETRRFTVACERDDQSLSTIYTLYSPYLYPFSVEYSILVVGVLYLVWQNIGMCKEEDDEEASTRQCKTPSGNNDNMESNVVIHADCHSSNKGLFGGFIVLVLTITSTILFFIAIYTDGGSQGELGVTVNIVTSLIILTSMTLACVLAYRQITKLDLNSAHHHLLDDVLLFICIPAYFLNGIFSIIPAIIYANVMGSINICLEVLQVLLQTCFILDGLRRSSNTKQLRQKKPGREMVTFLVICNVALWIMQTFEVKSHGMQDNRYDFYGKELWTILGHMCLPLMMFYRFHSSVCIGDIWKYAYEPSGH